MGSNKAGSEELLVMIPKLMRLLHLLVSSEEDEDSCCHSRLNSGKFSGGGDLDDSLMWWRREGICLSVSLQPENIYINLIVQISARWPVNPFLNYLDLPRFLNDKLWSKLLLLIFQQQQWPWSNSSITWGRLCDFMQKLSVTYSNINLDWELNDRKTCPADSRC